MTMADMAARPPAGQGAIRLARLMGGDQLLKDL
jgi:hypothetical protein